jgi:hypothetical protein
MHIEADLLSILSVIEDITVPEFDVCSSYTDTRVRVCQIPHGEHGVRKCEKIALIKNYGTSF